MSKCYFSGCLSGTDCGINIDECARRPCLHGVCIDHVNGYTCECTVPYTGVNCSVELNPCLPNRCRNGAQCVPDSTYRYSECRCPVGYTGTYCEKDRDECALSPNPCRNGGTCQNTNGSYHCRCVKGYEGRHCELNPDDCISGEKYIKLKFLVCFVSVLVDIWERLVMDKSLLADI